MPRTMLVFAVLALFLASVYPVQAEDNLFSVARMVVAAGVQEREPVGIADSFPAGTEKVYCFIEARDIQRSTEVRTVWFQGEEEIASVRLTLSQGPRWRTYSSVGIGNRTGAWRVELRDEADQMVRSIDFRVE